MSELLTLRGCHCGGKKLHLSKLSETHYEVRCSKCLDYAWSDKPDAVVEKWNRMQGTEENPHVTTSQPKTVKDCCKLSSNLIEEPTDKSENRVLRCRICGCKHIRLKAASGKLFSKPTNGGINEKALPFLPNGNIHGGIVFRNRSIPLRPSAGRKPLEHATKDLDRMRK